MRDAIRGLRTLFSSKGVKLVPLNEMVDAITVRRQAKKDIGACGGVLVGEMGGMLGVKMVVAITEGEDQSEERGKGQDASHTWVQGQRASCSCSAQALCPWLHKESPLHKTSVTAVLSHRVHKFGCCFTRSLFNACLLLRPAAVRDNWVRVRFGLYKDDLAKVVDVDNASQRASILLLPRLDLNAIATRVRGGGVGGRVSPRIPPRRVAPCIPPRRAAKGHSSGPGYTPADHHASPPPEPISCIQDEAEAKKFPFGRQGAVRPQAKPFNAEEARQLALSVTRTAGPDGQTYLQLGSHRFINGYIERNVAIRVRGWGDRGSGGRGSLVEGG